MIAIVSPNTYEYRPLRYCIFPVAGMGTRFLPATKNIPKEMLPLIDRPVIHYGVDEAVRSGCKEIVFVTGVGKEAIKEYFSESADLIRFLEESGNTGKIKEIESIHKMADFCYVTQDRPRGLGHAVNCAAASVDVGEAVGLILPDDVMLSENPVLLQLEAVRKKLGGSVIALERVASSETHRYGVIDGMEMGGGIHRIHSLVEKPLPGTSPSNLAVIGRYVLSHTIFSCLDKIKPGRNNEYQLTDALQLLAEQEPLWGVEYSGERLDCGTVPGWVEATVTMALRHDTLRPSVEGICRKWLSTSVENADKTV